MKRADVILGMIVLLVCAAWLGGRALLKKDGAYVEVRQDGKLFGRYALKEEQEIDIGSGNRVSIRDGAAQMIFADCPDQICIRQGRIFAAGAMITCLPNRVTVQVLGGGSADAEKPDAIAY